MATTVNAQDECMNRDMTNDEMDAHIANEPEFGPLRDAGACGLVGGAVAGGFSCHDSFLDSATIQLLSKGVEGTLCQFCAGACATAGDYCCGTPPAPVYYSDKTVNDCSCKDSFEYDGVTYDTCTDTNSAGAPWCEVTDECADGYSYGDDMGLFDYCIETDAPTEAPPPPYTGCLDVDEDTLGDEWDPIIETYGTACSLVRVLGGMDDGALTCNTELADSPSMQSAAPGVSGTLQDVCPRSCGCPEEGVDDECVDDTSGAGPEWDPIINMGGCAMLPTMATMGLTCDSDLADSAVVQGLAKGVSGSVRQFCGASCGGCEAPEEEAEVETPDVEEPKTKLKKADKKAKKAAKKAGKKPSKKALKKADKQCKKLSKKKCGKGKTKKVCEKQGKGKKATCGAIGM